MVNIIVVFPKLEDAKNIRNLLARNGYSVIGVCCTGIADYRQAGRRHCDLLRPFYRYDVCGFEGKSGIFVPDAFGSIYAYFGVLRPQGYCISAAAAAYRRSCQYAGDDGGRNVSTQAETEVTAEGTFRSREKSDSGCEKVTDGAKPYVRRRSTSLYAEM